VSQLPTEGSFLRDVAEHEMTILRDDGLYRHIRFAHPKSLNCGFEITTWPGFLAFSGDMGCYVFSRVPDMFKFFRRDTFVLGSGLHVNPGYWGEKLEAIDRHGGLKSYSAELFKSMITRWLDDAGASEDIRGAVEEEILTHADDEHEAMQAVYYFNHFGFTFDNFYEVEVREYTYRFLWCCFAVAWAVTKYDGRVKEAS
jgi:hypothetical protein